MGRPKLHTDNGLFVRLTAEQRAAVAAEAYRRLVPNSQVVRELVQAQLVEVTR